MTLAASEKLDCPNCGHEQEVTVWSTIIAQLNPELRTMLFDGQINTAECEECGCKAPLGAPLLYHDMRRDFCVQFYPPQAIGSDEFLGAFEPSYPVTLKGMPEDAGYLARPHLVFDMDDLVHCVEFFERLLPDDGRHEVRRVTPPKLGPRFEEALLLAVRAHGGQLRKGSEIPYISHLLSVCALVLEDGGDEDEAIAALLHDTLEDCPKEVTAPDLARRFGPRVADLVVQCTDTPPDYRGGPKALWRGRKAAYVERIREEPYPLCRVALADKLHNTRSVVLDQRRFGDKIWKRFKANKEDQIRHHRALVEAFREAKAPEYLVDELDSLVKELEASGGAA